MAGCTDSPAEPQVVHSGQAYAAVVRWLVDREGPTDTASDELPIVYVAPVEGGVIGADDQVGVVAEVHDVAVVRFADVADDALDLETDDRAVKEGGVLLIVGPVAEGASPIEVEVLEYHRIGDEQSWLCRVGGSTTTGFEVTSSSVTGSG